MGSPRKLSGSICSIASALSASAPTSAAKGESHGMPHGPGASAAPFAWTMSAFSCERPARGSAPSLPETSAHVIAQTKRASRHGENHRQKPRSSSSPKRQNTRENASYDCATWEEGREMVSIKPPGAKHRPRTLDGDGE